MLIRKHLTVASEIDWLEKSATPKRGSPERQAQCSVVEFLEMSLPAGSIVAAVKNEHGAKGKTEGQRKRFGAKRREEGVKAGFPDLVLCLPGPRVVFIEMKAPKSGVLSDAQRARHAELRALGFDVAVARSIETAKAALREMGVPLKGTAT